MDLKNENLFEVGAYSERGLVKFSTFSASSKWILKKGTITYEKMLRHTINRKFRAGNTALACFSENFLEVGSFLPVLNFPQL